MEVSLSALFAPSKARKPASHGFAPTRRRQAGKRKIDLLDLVSTSRQGAA
jgi:hypothetical protein